MTCIFTEENLILDKEWQAHKDMHLIEGALLNKDEINKRIKESNERREENKGRYHIISPAEGNELRKHFMKNKKMAYEKDEKKGIKNNGKNEEKHKSGSQNDAFFNFSKSFATSFFNFFLLSNVTYSYVIVISYFYV